LQSIAHFFLFAGLTAVVVATLKAGSLLPLGLLIATFLAVILIVRTFKAPAAPDPLSVTRRWYCQGGRSAVSRLAYCWLPGTKGSASGHMCYSVELEGTKEDILQMLEKSKAAQSKVFLAWTVYDAKGEALLMLPMIFNDQIRHYQTNRGTFLMASAWSAIRYSRQEYQRFASVTCFSSWPEEKAA
jgi:hypothetical protein